MSMTLQLQHRDELDALIQAQQDPGLPQYHQWLSPEQFTERFAPTPATYDAVAGWLRDNGFAVQVSPHRLRVDFSADVQRVEATFQVRMNRYRHHEQEALANDRPPVLPARFAGVVQSLRLHTFRFADPVVQVNGTPGVTASMGPQDIYTVYNVKGVLDSGIDGHGQTIAIVARSDFNASDVTSFQQQFGVPTRMPIKVFPAGNPGIGSPHSACAGYRNPRLFDQCVQGEEAEVLLDTEWASALAPGASILVDISDTDIDPSLTDIVNNHPEAKIISVSFGVCERLEPSAVNSWDALSAQAAAQGQTVLVASGNAGTDECQDGLGASVNALSSPQYITAVGGTDLDPGFDASGTATGRVSETVWNDPDGASGGGVSTLVHKPAYQTGPGVPGDGFRDQPDVSFMASPTTSGYVMVMENQVMVIGGTSAATPSWAGIVALVNHAAGVDGAGAINDWLYTLGRNQYATGDLPFFSDITSGNNGFDRVRGFNAGVGFDLATGWGSPNVALLVQALASVTPTPTPTFTATASITPTPTPTVTPTPPTLRTCPGDCNGDGMVTVDELLTAVDIGLGSTPLSRCAAVDANDDGNVTVDEITQATNRALNGC